MAKRITLASKMIYEVRAVVEDSRSQVAGGMAVGFTIWESCIQSMLLYGAQVWSEIPKKTMSALNKISLKNLRVSCGIGKHGYCTPFLLFECGELLVENRILMMQLLFIFHLANLPTNSLGREVYETQLSLELPGVVTKTKPILNELNITNPRVLSKAQYRKIIMNYIKSKNKNDLLLWMQKFKKIDYKFYENRP